MHEERNHKPYSPSQADRFFVCPGSVKLLLDQPARRPTKYSIEGTKAHEILEVALSNGYQDVDAAIADSVYCLEEFEDDFKWSIKDALDYIYQLCDDLGQDGGDFTMYTEQAIRVPVNAAPGEADGYSDIAIVSRKRRVLYVIDFKNGAGVLKAASSNKQVSQYSLGLVYGPDAIVSPDEIDLVIMVIIQPRAFHPEGEIRTFTTTPLALLDYQWELEEAIERCEAPDAALVPGQEQCQFCDARAVCPAVRAVALSVLDPQSRSISDFKASRLANPTGMTMEQLGYIKKMKPHVMAWFNAVDERIEHALHEGIPVPYFKLADTAERRQWFGPEKESVKKLAALIGCSEDDLYTKERKPLTHVEEMVKRAFKDRVGRSHKKLAAEEANKMFAFFTLKQSSGKLTVVPEEDPRPAINKSARSFAAVGSLLLPPPKST